MSTLPSCIKHLCIGIFISSPVASGFLSSSLLYGQTVTFASAQTTLPTSGLYQPYGVAVDSAGDVFIAEPFNNNRVVELPKAATGYGPQTTLPTSGLSQPYGVAVDSAGDVFIADYGNNRVVELPWAATSYGPQTTLPTSGLSQPVGVAVDSAGDLFIGDNTGVEELPWTTTGYGQQITLYTQGIRQLATDNAGDVFISSNALWELPRTATGYGQRMLLPVYGFDGPPGGVAVDRAGDVFIADYGNNRVLELPWTGTGYGPQTTLQASVSSPWGVAVDSAGDVFIADLGTNRAVEVQTRSVNFEGVDVCAPGQTTPAPCSNTLTLNYGVTAGGTLGTPKVLTGGVPNLDFTLASGSTCTGELTAGAACTVNVTFAPQAMGLRNGSVEITDGSGIVLATTPISGFGLTPPTIDFSQGFGQAQGDLQCNGSASSRVGS